MSLNQSEFFLANQVDGVLTDAQRMQMLELPEGDTAQADTGAPAAGQVDDDITDVVDKNQPAPAGTQEPASTATPAEPTPVILAKDGVHTISYDKLVEARQAEQHWRQVAEQAQAKLDAMAAGAQPAPAAGQQPAAAAPAAGDTSLPADEDLFGDYSEEAIKAGVEKLVAIKTAAIAAQLEARFATVLEPIQKQAQVDATDEHFNAIEAKHPDFESVAASAEMEAWISKQPTFVQAGYRAVLSEGTAPQVIELLDAYKSATGKTTPAPAGDAAAAQAAARAQAAIERAQDRSAPLSLSAIPAASNVQHDQAQAMLEMSSTGLLNLFEGKTPEQVNALMSRVL